MDKPDPPAFASYRARFRAVLEHIDAHLAEDLSVERLSRVAHFSKYHFHRQFSALFDVSVRDYVQLVRLKRAANELAFCYWRSVLEVALDSGYESPEAFARAFKKHLGQTPSAFQRSPDWTPWDALYRPAQTIRREHMTPTYRNEDVAIRDFPATPVAALEHLGPPSTIRESVRRFIEWRRAHGLPPQSHATFNIFHHDPANTPPDAYRMDICVASTRDVAANSFKIVNKIIPSGRCAVLRHVGPDPLTESIRFLYLHWLPASGESPRDFPLFAQRVIFPPYVPEHQALTDIHLPLI